MTEAGPKLLRGLLEVFLLESLEQQPKHGYALLKEMTEVFGAQPSRNRLYPLLAKLVSEGFVREVQETGGGNRTLFALTTAGQEALRAYRHLPPAFRHALRRIWSVDTHPADAASSTEAGVDADAISDSDDDADDASLSPPALDAGAAPFPCVDARVALEKDARSGTMTLTLTGCPMGAFDYCSSCPIYKGVAALVLTSSTK